MKTFLAPNGEYITIPDGRVTTFGLSKEQNELVKNALPAKGYELLDTDAPTDLIAISAAALIINAAALDSDSKEMIIDYYTEIGGCTDETVFWLGYPCPQGICGQSSSVMKILKDLPLICNITFYRHTANLKKRKISVRKWRTA